MFRTSHTELCVWLTVSGVLVAGTPPVLAQTTIDWINPGTGLFHDPANWLGGVVPSSSDTAVFDLAGAPVVQWGVNAYTTNTKLLVRAGDVTFQSIGGPMYSYNVDDAIIAGGSLTLDSFDLGMSNSPEVDSSLTVDSGGALNLLNGSEVSDDPRSVIVGKTGHGTLNILGGSSISNSSSVMGYTSGSNGTATVSGADSTWTNYDLMIGLEGSGSMSILDGGLVTVNGSTYTGRESTGSGLIAFNNGTLTTRELFADTADLTGSGIINTSGLVSDTDLVFDSTHGLQQQIILNSLPGQNVTINLDQHRSQALGVGYRGTGNLTIAEGAVVDSFRGYLGYHAGSTGTATVTGTGSTWNGGHTYVGYYGNGVLTIENGGLLSGSYGRIGYRAGSTGTATVTGAGSSWSVFGLNVGSGGTGNLVIEEGGAVNVSGSTTIGSTGQIAFSGGTLTTGDLRTDLARLAGTGTIHTSGLQSDLDLVFDATHGLQQQFIINDLPEQDITINLDQNQNGDLGAGYSGLGTLTIADGMHVRSSGGSLGIATGSTGLATITGTGTTWDISSRLMVGGAGNGALIVDAGASVTSRRSSIGSSSSATGIVTVSGAGSYLGATDELAVGSSGHGALTISDGGFVESESSFIGYFAGSSGAVVITDPGSSWLVSSRSLYVGYRGDGSLTIQNGGSLTTTARFYESLIAHEEGSTGSVTVTGPGSIWTSQSNIHVGVKGIGMMTVSDGGSVLSESVFVGSGYEGAATGTVTVTGPGSVWEATGGFTVGSRGQGTLRIENGGTVSSDRGGSVGNYTGSTGTATVTGAGSAWDTAGTLYVGNDGGEGTLYITSGGTVTSQSGVIGGGPSYRTGTGAVTVSDATLTYHDSLFVGGEENRAGGEGTLTITDGGTVRVGDTLKLWSLGTVDLIDGALAATTVDNVEGSFNFLGGTLDVAAVTGDLVNQGGTLAPGGNTVGSTAINGHYTQQPDAVLEIEIGGPLAGSDFDLLQVTGVASLAGTLKLTLADGFNPIAGDTFRILTAGARSGEFNSVLGRDLGNGLAFDPLYGSNRVLIEVIQIPLLGDLNNDGFVGIDDLNIILSHWNEEAGVGNFQIGDVTGDGLVGIQDLNTVLGNWHAGTLPPAETNSVVPEPASIAMLLLGGMSLLRRRQ